MTDRRLPHDSEAERAVLGAILVRGGALEQASALTPEAFYHRAHQQIFAAALAVFTAGVAVDLLTVKAKLETRGELGSVGGFAYLTGLTDGVPVWSHVESHAGIVREKALLRLAIQAGAQLVDQAYTADRPALELMAETDTRLLQLASTHVSGELVPSSSLMHALFPVLEEAYQRKRAITGIQTGWRALDEFTLGLHPGKLVYVAARTSQGKSALTLNLAADVAKQGHPVALFSLEDSKEDIAMRLAAAESGVSLYRMRSGYLNDRDWAPISHALGSIGSAPLFVDDTPRLSVPDLRAKARRVQAQQQRLGLVIVDYVQLMHAPGKHENHARELTVISNGLKQVAKELQVPIVGCVQLNRENDKDERRPRLTDLKGSGSLEQDADLVLLIYRPDVHDPKADEGLTEIIIGKQRNGPTGTVKLRFLKDRLRFIAWQDEPTREIYQ